MSDDFTFDLVSPEKQLASHTASAVEIPGAEGNMTAMAGHAPTITTLRPGILRVTHGGQTDEYVVSGGFAEISAASVSVLAERSVKREDLDQDTLNAFIAEAKAMYHKAAEQKSGNLPGPVDEAAKLLADMVSMGEQMGLDASVARD